MANVAKASMIAPPRIILAKGRAAVGGIGGSPSGLRSHDRVDRLVDAIRDARRSRIEITRGDRFMGVCRTMFGSTSV
jgi:hypothetical protein